MFFPNAVPGSKYRHKNLGLSTERYYRFYKGIIYVLTWFYYSSMQRKSKIIPIENYTANVFDLVKPNEDEMYALMFMVSEEYAKGLVPESISQYYNIIQEGVKLLEIADPGTQVITLTEWRKAIKDSKTVKSMVLPPDDFELRVSMEIIEDEWD